MWPNTNDSGHLQSCTSMATKDIIYQLNQILFSWQDISFLHYNSDHYTELYYILWFVFMWSPAIWSLNGDHIADATFLYKIVPSVNLLNIHQINIRCIVCNKNHKHVQSVCGDSFFLVGVSHASSGLVR